MIDYKNKTEIYNVLDNKIMYTLKGSGVFSPNGKLVLTNDSDNITKIYEVSNGKLLHTFKQHYADSTSRR